MSTHEPMHARGRQEALYVYGFARAGEVGPVSIPGVSGSDDVRTVELGDVDAIVSPIALEEFLGPEGGDRTRELEWVAPRAVRHVQVVEEVMRTSPVLPVMFGAVFSSPQSLMETVGAHRAQIADFLQYIADKEEWALKIFADPRQIRRSLQDSSEYRRRIAQAPESAGARYFHEKRLARELDQRTRGEGSRLADLILDELAPLAIEVKGMRISPREITGRADDMALHCALLLTKPDGVERFTNRVRQLAAEHAQRGITLEATGPWPPYSFCPRLEEERS